MATDRSNKSQRRVRLDDTADVDRRLMEALERLERARSKAVDAVGTILASAR